MRLAFSHLLLSLAIGLCFKLIYAQERNETDTNVTTTLLNYETVDVTLSPEVTVENVVTELPATPDQNHAVSTPDYKISTMHEEPTVEATTLLITEIEQTTSQTKSNLSDSEGTTAQGQHTTMALEPMEASTTAVAIRIETGVTAPITSEYLPSTMSYELTSAMEHRAEITTEAFALTTASTAWNSTPNASQPPAEGTEFPTIMSIPEDTTFLTSTTKASTTTLISTSKLIFRGAPDLHFTLSEDDSVSTNLTPTTMGGYVNQSILPTQTNWLLIIIVCVIIICVLFGALLLFVQRRKKNASHKFSPGYVNGRSKRSMKKKGAEDDAWAGPVNLEAGERVDCDGEVQRGLLSDEGRGDGDDMALITFAALESGDTSNGGVGGDGTTEGKKWDEQEPLLYIDEDLEEAVSENERQKGDENSGKLDVKEIKDLNGGEAFCLTTAV
ncbi:mucin-5B-like [Xyrauchen texanus]|uniref:mucin-5B-like n=1 Tax=Xyrauchen texanus TaxID=154827 RepID=UPI00224237F3|nr:mucin-5B-like [Xyrauchen texanus]XP_051995326.1 mucin-5B-like [Xyrauchen texanus]